MEFALFTRAIPAANSGASSALPVAATAGGRIPDTNRRRDAHPTRSAAPRTRKAREEARSEIADAMGPVTTPTGPACRAATVASGQREFVRRAPIGERRHFAPA